MLFSLSGINVYADDSVTGMIIYVSPDGDDESAGTEEAPLATLKGARDKIREIKKSSGLPVNGITVLFRGGEYFWTETVTFTDEDSGTKEAPIRYSAYPGEEPCFTGGTRIPGSEFSKITNEDILQRLRGGQATRENARQINIKDYFTNFKNEHNLGETTLLDWYPYIYDVSSTSFSSYEQYHTLYKNLYGSGYTEYMSQFGPTDRTGTIKRTVYSIGDQPALWAARYPNKEPGEGGVEENPYPVYMKTGEVLQSPWTVNPTDTSLSGIFRYSDDRISQYAGYDDVWIDQYSTIFYHDMLRLKEIDPVNKTIETMVRPSHSLREGADFCIFNILEEMDSPGEMYIDKNTGMMYIYPNGDLDNTFLNISVFTGNYLITTEGTSFVSFNGISVENTQGSGMMISGGESMEINYCNFRDMGIGAIRIGDSSKVRYWQLPNEWRISSRPQDETYNDVIMEYYNFYIDPARSVDVLGKNHRLYGTHVKNTGMSSVSLTGGNSWRDEECNYVVENCDITYPGVYKPTYEPAVALNNCFGIKLLNNKLAHAPGQLINGYLLKGEIAYNYLYDAMSYMMDQGMVYLNYTVMGLDIDIHNNWLRQIPEDDHVAPYHTQRFGIYFDDGVTQGLKIRNNIFQDMSSAMQKPVVNSSVTGNIFIECVDLHSKYTSAMTSTNELFMYPAAETKDFYKSEKNVSLVSNLPAGSREWNYILALLPVNAAGEVGEHYQKLWREKYPTIMQYLDIIESQEHKGNFFVNIRDNLIVKRERKDWYANNFKFEDMEQYPASGCVITNNVYTDNNDCFVDYYNEDFTLTDEFANKYGLKSVDQSEIGLLTENTGTELYKKVVTDIPVISVDAVKQTTAVDLSSVSNAAVLKINSSEALLNGAEKSIDAQNSEVTPQIVDSRTLVPVRFIAESFGGKVAYDEKTQLITIEIDGKTVNMTLGEKEIYVDGEVKAISDVEAQSVNGRTMIPLRVFCETVLEKTVYWHESGVIIISDDAIYIDDALIEGINEILI